VEQNRFKSPVVWAAIAAQVLAILLLAGVIGETMNAALSAAVTGLLEIGVLVGILNDPTDAKHF